MTISASADAPQSGYTTASGTCGVQDEAVNCGVEYSFPVTTTGTGTLDGATTHQVHSAVALAVGFALALVVS